MRDNIIIHKIDELESQVTEERLRHDVQEVIKLTSDDHFGQVVRLGRFESGKTRPIIVEFRKNEDKVNLFQNLGMLREAPVELKKLSINHDMTKLQREKEKKLWEEAKEKEANSLGEYLFRVRGSPWSNRIRQIPRVPQQHNQAGNQPGKEYHVAADS